MPYQTKLRTHVIIPNDNICFPIGTILAVKNKYDDLDFSGVFDKYKKKGRDINSLIQGLLSYKLTENLSISKASKWINRGEVLETFNLENFEERTLFRTLETIGNNREEIISDIQDRLFQTHNFEHTDINLDWTSLVLYGDKSKLGKYGYSRDHRLDKKQITVGISELVSPINIPIGITVKKGNLNDMKYFADTYQQINDWFKLGSLIIFDKEVNSNLSSQVSIEILETKYLTKFEYLIRLFQLH